jgi:hypothetical protein
MGRPMRRAAVAAAGAAASHAGLFQQPPVFRRLLKKAQVQGGARCAD